MYDFTSRVNREGTGAAKYIAMKKINPDVPEGIVPLSVADMEFKMAPEIIRGLTSYLKDMVLGYTAPGDAWLDSIRGWMRRRHGWETEREWIIPAEGVIGAFFNAVQAFTGPGDGVIIMTPVYPPFYTAVERNRRRVIRNELKVENGRYVIDFEDLEKKAQVPENKLLILCNPHNPVGRVWERQELEQISTICIKNNVIVVSDEIHFDFIMKGYKHTVFTSLGGEAAENSLVLCAPSKTFNLAGLHASYAVIPKPEIRKRYHDTLLTHGAHPGLNSLAYRATEIAYTECETWLDELLSVLDSNKRLVERFMAERIPAIKVFPLEGTYLQWWDCRDLDLRRMPETAPYSELSYARGPKGHTDSRELEHFMTHEAFLFLGEGYIFGEGGKGHERINLACPQSVLQESLERLEKALQKRNLIRSAAKQSRC
ncbi:MAG: pyridoxal phosphate-dependent aminotransferase [Treponema sp.]|jgi:aminotransferase/cystathionine beta-lyase|nr:pyridoxal phosphate-dependent aminotransferase [Treponema sp.]